jgi:hypothetical protein
MKPAFAPYHGLHRPGDDRRAWALEVQVHGDVALNPGDDGLREVVVDDKDLLREMPPSLRQVAVHPPDRAHDESFDAYVAARIRALVEAS